MCADRPSGFWKKFAPRGGADDDSVDADEAAETEAPPRRQPYRWVRRNDSSIIPIEAAVDGPTADVQVAEQKRLATEMRARQLESVVEALEKQLSGLQETVQIVSRRARYYETSYKSLAAQKTRSTPSAKDIPNPVEERLYAQVGLHPGCPDFVIEATRKAFLARHHPDRVPPADRERATVEFQYYEKIFRTLAEQRRVSGARQG